MRQTIHSPPFQRVTALSVPAAKAGTAPESPAKAGLERTGSQGRSKTDGIADHGIGRTANANKEGCVHRIILGLIRIIRE